MSGQCRLAYWLVTFKSRRGEKEIMQSVLWLRQRCPKRSEQESGHRSLTHFERVQTSNLVPDGFRDHKKSKFNCLEAGRRVNLQTRPVLRTTKNQNKIVQNFCWRWFKIYSFWYQQLFHTPIYHFLPYQWSNSYCFFLRRFVITNM